MPGCLLRLAPVVYAASLLFWLSLEESSALVPALLGWCGAALMAWRGWQAKPRSMERLRPALWAALLGLGAGAGAALIAAALMFFKTAWHNHPYPDYPPLMMLAMLERLPAWALAGGLLGLAGHWLRLALQPSSGGAAKTPSAPGA